MRDMKAATIADKINITRIHNLQCRYLHIPYESPQKTFYCLKHGICFNKTRPVCIIGFSKKKLNNRKTTVIGLRVSLWVRCHIQLSDRMIDVFESLIKFTRVLIITIAFYFEFLHRN